MRLGKGLRLQASFASHGIWKGVGVSGLERFYVIFGLRLDGVWMPLSVWREVGVEERRIFNIFDLQTFKVTIGFTPKRRIVG